MKKKLLIAIPLIVVCLVVIIIVIYNNTNKLERYLKKEGYNCNKTTCNIEKNGENYSINLETGEYIVKGPNVLIINATTATYKIDNLICTFKHDLELTEYTEDDINDSNCLVYIYKVNNEVNSYRKIIDESKVDLSTLK